MNHAGHQHAASSEQRADGAARAQLSKLFFGWLDDAAGGRPVTGGVCYCCKTSVATGPDGAVYAAWRHVYPGNVRDIAFAMSADGGRTFGEPVRVSDDNWVLDGCPENGPSLAVDGGGRVHVVWPTLVPGKTAGDDPVPALFYATSADGRRFTPRQLVPTEGFPRHPQIAIVTANLKIGPTGVSGGSTGEVIAVWDEQADNGKRIALARGVADSTGVMRFVRQPVGDASAASYPVVAAAHDAPIVAWVSGTGAGTVIRAQRLGE